MKPALAISLLLVLFLFSCNKPPEACITVDNSSVSVGTPITFSAECSKRSLSYIWSFEGPSGAAENNMQFSEEVFSRAFATAGNYTVTLEAYERFSWLGQSGTTTTEITIN